ncbi:MAG: FecR domain-containing protein [Blastocatellia bacterium]
MYFKRLRIASFACVMAMLSGVAGLAQGLVSARVVSSEGAVEIRRRAAGRAEIQKIAFKANEEVRGGDTIVTGRGGRLVLGLSDGSQAVIAPQTTVVVEDLSATPRALFNLLRGKTRVRIEKMGGQPNPYRVNTPTAVIAVRGTIFDVLVKDGQTDVFLHEGEVSVASPARPDQPVLLFPGQTTRIRPRALPNSPGMFKPGRNDGDFRMKGARGENRQIANRGETPDSSRAGSPAHGSRERARVESRPDAGRTSSPSSRPQSGPNSGGGRGRP